MFTEKQLKAIGCLVIESTHLEQYIEALIRTYAGETVSGLLLHRKMMDAKTDILKSLIINETKDDKLKKKLGRLFSNIKTDIVSRNTVVHGDWGLAREMPLEEMIRQKRRGTAAAFRNNPKSPVKAKDIMNLAHRFADHQMKLLDLWDEFSASLAPSPDKF